MSKEKVFIYNRESFISSLAADCITFGFLIGLMFLNFDYWHGHWYVTIFMLFIWLIFASARGSKRIHTFYSIEDCINFLKNQKEK